VVFDAVVVVVRKLVVLVVLELEVVVKVELEVEDKIPTHSQSPTTRGQLTGSEPGPEFQASIFATVKPVISVVSK